MEPKLTKITMLYMLPGQKGVNYFSGFFAASCHNGTNNSMRIGSTGLENHEVVLFRLQCTETQDN